MNRLAPLTLFLASAAFATTLLAVDVPTLSRSADLILLGTVNSSKARLTEAGRIMTDTEIKVSEVLKGTASATVLVMQPGGIVGEVGQRVEGTAPFKAGEEVLVFLDARGGSDHFMVTGMIQGKFKIERSSDGKAVYAVPESASSARLIDPVTHLEASSGLQPLALPVLKAQIAATLAGLSTVVDPSTRPLTPKVGR